MMPNQLQFKQLKLHLKTKTLVSFNSQIQSKLLLLLRLLLLLKLSKKHQKTTIVGLISEAYSTGVTTMRKNLKTIKKRLKLQLRMMPNLYLLKPTVLLMKLPKLSLMATL